MPIARRRIRRRVVAPISIAELVSMSSPERAQLWGELEERIKAKVEPDQLALLYHVDGLTLREVNDYIDFIVGPGFYLEGDPSLVKTCSTWIDKVKLKRILEEVVRDIFVFGAGNAWVELGFNQQGTDVLKLSILNPKTMDFIRDALKNVELDENQEPVGYKQTRIGLYGAEVEWRKDRIIKNGEVVWIAPEGQDGRDRIAHFKLFSLGESFLGMSPLEAVYKQAVIRLNLEENVGESSFRSGGIIAYIGREGLPEPTPEEIDKIVNALRNITTQSIFGFPIDIKIERFPTPDLRDRVDLITYFASIQSVGMGIPLTRHLLPSGRLAARITGSMEIDFEQRIMALQDRLAEQVREKLLFRLLKARGLVTEYDQVPRVIFRTRSPHLLEKTINMISRLARRDVVRRDPELEKKIREELGLPTKYLDRELEQWDRDISRVPSRSKPKTDVDIDEIAQDISEAIEEVTA